MWPLDVHYGILLGSSIKSSSSLTSVLPLSAAYLNDPPSSRGLSQRSATTPWGDETEPCSERQEPGKLGTKASTCMPRVGAAFPTEPMLRTR
ncbi:hypothetical protein NPIL_236551 [Nephila pilipes]|uniref:Uncharacterized protein n=1 Tax=Nephila pilipes TaxID=299642 RepID=A0A8X6N7S3_NEPPI|nr:hypothetical protein NPIL_236551 [Nephila pilipes]